TNIPPHNLGEAVEAINHLVDHPDASIKDLRKFIKGPDFPTGAIIYGREGIKECYEKGRGRIAIRARATVEEREATGKQQIVITRRTEFELKRAQDREHILEGLKIAVDNIDEVVKIIRKSKDTPSADASLRKRFKLSEKQSAEILNMRLARLTALEITKLEDELKEVRK